MNPLNPTATANYSHFSELSLEEATQFGEYRELSVAEIIEDPDNRQVFGLYETDGLSMSISENGFQGAVLVYPFKGKYRLQSGHRSLEAAKKAGYKTVPAIISSPPETEIERRKNLIIPNTHERDKTPMRMARMVAYHFETLEMEKKAQLEEGKEPSNPNITDKTALDLEISPAQVTKYRALLKLIPALQRLADKRTIPWSALVTSGAGKLTEDQQRLLAKRLNGLSLMEGSENITAKKVRQEVFEISHIIPSGMSDTTSFDRFDTSLYSNELTEEISLSEKEFKKKANSKGTGKKEKKTRKRRKNGYLAIKKSSHLLNDGFDSNALIKQEDRPKCLEYLRAMRKLIDENIGRFESL